MVDPADLQALAARYHLPEAHGAALGALAEACTVRELAPDTSLCEEGRPADGLYLLLEGALRVEKRDARLAYRPLAVARAPALLGHMGLVTGANRTAALVAEERCRVAVLPVAAFRRLQDDPGPAGDALRRLVLRAMLDQAHRATQDVRRLLAAARAEEGFTARDPTGWESL